MCGLVFFLFFLTHRSLTHFFVRTKAGKHEHMSGVDLPPVKREREAIFVGAPQQGLVTQ